MAQVPIPSRKERFLTLIESPDFLEDLCANIACGHTLTGAAKLHDIPYAWLMRWVRQDDERASRVEAAKKDREEWAKELVFDELRAIATSNLQELYDAETGELLPIDRWPEWAAKCVQGLETEELFEGMGGDRIQVGQAKKVKLWDKMKALEMLGRKLGIFTENHNHNHNFKLEDLVAASQPKQKLPQGKA